MVLELVRVLGMVGSGLVIPLRILLRALLLVITIQRTVAVVYWPTLGLLVVVLHRCVSCGCLMVLGAELEEFWLQSRPQKRSQQNNTLRSVKPHVATPKAAGVLPSALDCVQASIRLDA